MGCVSPASVMKVCPAIERNVRLALRCQLFSDLAPRGQPDYLVAPECVHDWLEVAHELAVMDHDECGGFGQVRSRRAQIASQRTGSRRPGEAVTVASQHPSDHRPQERPMLEIEPAP